MVQGCRAAGLGCCLSCPEVGRRKLPCPHSLEKGSGKRQRGSLQRGRGLARLPQTSVTSEAWLPGFGKGLKISLDLGEILWEATWPRAAIAGTISSAFVVHPRRVTTNKPSPGQQEDWRREASPHSEN